MAESTTFTTRRRRPKLGTLLLIGLAHVVVVYGLAKAFAPDFTGSFEREVLSTFQVTVTTPKDPPPPPPPPEPDPEPAGASGEEGVKAIPREVVAPEPKVRLERDDPAPRASSTGDANSAGASDRGSGTGAGGTGTGTGSGNGGTGTGGGGPVTKPVHIAGGIDNARDYPVPEGGRSARRGNDVIVQVTVGTDGRASNCRIYRPSADPEADRITCRLVVERLRFRPAVNSAGEPVPAPFYWQQKWF